MIHLHVHTEYSLRDSLVSIPKLVENTKESVAITDHGTLGGWIEFVLECQKKNKKPILGVEAYCSKDLHVKDNKEKLGHITLIAINKTGYKNLIILNNIAYSEGFYYRPRIDQNLLSEYSDGIIALTGCLSSVVYHWDIWALAEKMPVYLEIMALPLEEQKKHNFHLLSQYTGFPVVITNDVHYLKKEDQKVHEVLIKMQNRDIFTAGHLCDEEEITQVFQKEHQYIKKSTIEEGLKNTYTIANMIEGYEITFGNIVFPKFLEG